MRVLNVVISRARFLTRKLWAGTGVQSQISIRWRAESHLIGASMRRTLIVCLLVLVAPVVVCAAQETPSTQPAEAGRAQGAQAGANVPVKAVVLFSSGVGYFEHFGTVQGDGSTELRFKTNQINDIL